MSDLPRLLIVGPYHVHIRCDSETMLAVRNENQDQRVGNFSNSQLTITLDPSMAPDMLAETLLHETIHAVVEASGSRATKLDAEGWIAVVAPTLLATLRQNPELLAYLLEPGSSSPARFPGPEDHGSGWSSASSTAQAASAT